MRIPEPFQTRLKSAASDPAQAGVSDSMPSTGKRTLLISAS